MQQSGGTVGIHSLGEIFDFWTILKMDPPNRPAPVEASRATGQPFDRNLRRTTGDCWRVVGANSEESQNGRARSCDLRPRCLGQSADSACQGFPGTLTATLTLRCGRRKE